MTPQPLVWIRMIFQWGDFPSPERLSEIRKFVTEVAIEILSTDHRGGSLTESDIVFESSHKTAEGNEVLNGYYRVLILIDATEFPSLKFSQQRLNDEIAEKIKSLPEFNNDLSIVALRLLPTTVSRI